MSLHNGCLNSNIFLPHPSGYNIHILHDNSFLIFLIVIFIDVPLELSKISPIALTCPAHAPTPTVNPHVVWVNGSFILWL